MILFICSQAYLRSRTAEILTTLGGLAARSAGTDPTAEAPVTNELLRSADVVFCMEPAHQILISEFPSVQANPPHVLGIPDDYFRLDDALIDLLISRTAPLHPPTSEALARGAVAYRALPDALQLGLCDGAGRRKKALHNA